MVNKDIDSSHLREMSLEFVPGVGFLLYSLGESDVSIIPVLPHVVGALIEGAFNFIPQLFARRSLAL